MCDNDIHPGVVDFSLSRRDFALMAGATAAALGAGGAWSAGTGVERKVTIKTPDGDADALLNLPAEKGRWPAVLVWPDALSLRPAYGILGSRLAALGLAVLTVNPYYRWVKSPLLPKGKIDPNDPATRKYVYGFMERLTTEINFADAKSFVAYLDSLPEVDTSKPMGVHGYCMGGPLMMRTAATFPDRVRAGASFHGASLVTDKSDSPHLLTGRLRGDYLLAIAENDDQKQPAEKEALRKAFADAKVPAKIEVYSGALHGWSIPGNATYNADASEKGMLALIDLYKRKLLA